MEQRCFRCLLNLRIHHNMKRRPYLSDVPKASFTIDGMSVCLDCAWKMTDEDYLLKELNERTSV